MAWLFFGSHSLKKLAAFTASFTFCISRRKVCTKKISRERKAIYSGNVFQGKIQSEFDTYIHIYVYTIYMNTT